MTNPNNPGENSEPLSWQDRLKHLEPADENTLEVEDFVSTPKEEEQDEDSRPALPEGVSFSKSRITAKEDLGVPVVDKILSKVPGLNKRSDINPRATEEQSTEQQSPKAAPAKPSIPIRQQFKAPQESVDELVKKVSVSKLVADHIKTKRLIWVGIAVVMVGATAAFASLALGGGGEVGYWMRRIFLLPFPICLGLALNEIALKVGSKHPLLARKTLGILTFGNMGAKRGVAAMDIDMGNYESAEKVLSGVVKGINKKKKPKDYITSYAYLASVRANVGKVVDAEKQILKLLETAKDYYDSRPNDANATMLATTLVYAAQVSDWQDKHDDALKFYSVAIKLLCDQKSPSADLLANTLASAGYQYNLAGRHEEALVLLTKAREISDRMPDARVSTKVLIIANYGIAQMGLGNVEKAAEHLKEAEEIAQSPIAAKELPNVYQAQAVLQRVTQFKEAADQAYKKSINALLEHKPSENLQLVRVLQDYADFQKSTGYSKEAEKYINQATQIKYTLDQHNYTLETVEKDEVAQVEVPALKSRFPFFWTLIAIFMAWRLLEGGLRVEGFTGWIFPVMVFTVLTLKLFCKFGSHAEEDASQGAILAVISAIPFARHVVPELSVLPRKTISIVIGVALLVLVFVNFTAPPPHKVPDSGLLSYEYFKLACNLINELDEKYTLAFKAADLAAKPDISGNYTKQVAALKEGFLPRYETNPEVLDENSRALRLYKEEPMVAKRIWTTLMEKHPKFEAPFINMSTVILSESDLLKIKNKDEFKKKVKEAGILAEKGLEINPEYAKGLIAYSNVLILQNKRKVGMKYFKRGIGKYETMGGMAAGMVSILSGTMDMAEEKIEEAEQDLKHSKSTKESTESTDPEESKNSEPIEETKPETDKKD